MREDQMGRDRIDRTPSPRTAWDFEHLEVEELYAAARLWGSRLAAEELLLIAEGTLTWGLPPSGAFHSSRTLGWWLRVMARAYQISDNPRYCMVARSALGMISDGSYLHYLNRTPDDPDLLPEKWYLGILTRENQKTMWGLLDHPAEACWQAAVTGSAAFLWSEIDGDMSYEWRGLGARAAFVVKACWKASGLAENACVLHAETSGEVTLAGTRSWCFDTWARAYKADPETYGDVVTAWEAVADKRMAGHYPWRPGGQFWHLWCLKTAAILGTHA
jgi:hypothetical protein